MKFAIIEDGWGDPNSHKKEEGEPRSSAPKEVMFQGMGNRVNGPGSYSGMAHHSTLPTDEFQSYIISAGMVYSQKCDVHTTTASATHNTAAGNTSQQHTGDADGSSDRYSLSARETGAHQSSGWFSDVFDRKGDGATVVNTDGDTQNECMKD